jgi:hypothetical protein
VSDDDRVKGLTRAVLNTDRYNTSAPLGWSKIVEELVQAADESGAVILQVKEKFGTLRFYVSGGNGALHALIDKAERRSASTCEACGADRPEDDVKRTHSVWLRTLCARCRLTP